jgi:hypothetical protein
LAVEGAASVEAPAGATAAAALPSKDGGDGRPALGTTAPTTADVATAVHGGHGCAPARSDVGVPMLNLASVVPTLSEAVTQRGMASLNPWTAWKYTSDGILVTEQHIREAKLLQCQGVRRRACQTGGRCTSVTRAPDIRDAAHTLLRASDV